MIKITFSLYGSPVAILFDKGNASYEAKTIVEKQYTMALVRSCKDFYTPALGSFFRYVASRLTNQKGVTSVEVHGEPTVEDEKGLIF